MTEVWCIGLEAEEESVIAESLGDIHMDLVQVRPDIPGTVSMPGIVPFRWNPLVVPVQITVPVQGHAMGDRTGERLLLPVVPRHHADESGIHESRYHPVSPVFWSLGMS